MNEGLCFSENLFILVNGCSIDEINIHIGLKQRDPLAPLLFLLVVEGLSASFKREVSLGLFSGVQVGSSRLEVFHL